MRAAVEQELGKDVEPIIFKLLRSGFAEVDQERSDWRVKRFIYRFTPAGKDACFRYRDATPIGWAEAIRSGHTRHCVVCGRDCYRRRVWAKSGAFRCVCLACGAKGHGLQDLREQ